MARRSYRHLAAAAGGVHRAWLSACFPRVRVAAPGRVAALVALPGRGVFVGNRAHYTGHHEDHANYVAAYGGTITGVAEEKIGRDQ